MQLTAEHDQLRRTVARFVAEDVNPYVKDWEAAEQFPSHKVFKKMGDLGLLGVKYPEEDGGLGLDFSYSMIVAEELEVAWEDVIVEQAALNTNWYKRQVAGGSQSIRKEWESLRMAGATAKQMLLMAAAQQWEVSLRLALLVKVRSRMPMVKN